MKFSHCPGVNPGGGFWSLHQCWVLIHPFAVCLHLQARWLTDWAEGGTWGRSLCLVGCLGRLGCPALSLPFSSACGKELSLSKFIQG